MSAATPRHLSILGDVLHQQQALGARFDYRSDREGFDRGRRGIVLERGAAAVDAEEAPEGGGGVRGEGEPQSRDLLGDAPGASSLDDDETGDAAGLALAASVVAYWRTTAERTLPVASDAFESSRTATSTSLSLHTPPSTFWKLWIVRAYMSS
jgi:hypothetical protein